MINKTGRGWNSALKRDNDFNKKIEEKKKESRGGSGSNAERENLAIQSFSSPRQNAKEEEDSNSVKRLSPKESEFTRCFGCGVRIYRIPGHRWCRRCYVRRR